MYVTWQLYLNKAGGKEYFIKYCNTEPKFLQGLMFYVPSNSNTYF